MAEYVASGFEPPDLFAGLLVNGVKESVITSEYQHVLVGGRRTHSEIPGLEPPNLLPCFSVNCVHIRVLRAEIYDSIIVNS